MRTELESVEDVLQDAATRAMARSLGPGVWDVHNLTEEWCIELVSALRHRSSQVVLWLGISKPYDVELEPLGGCCWKLPAAVTTKTLLQSLYEGGWAMFFGDQVLLSRVGTLPSALPTKPAELRALVAESGADALIVSWYDDVEWLLVSKPMGSSGETIPIS